MATAEQQIPRRGSRASSMAGQDEPLAAEPTSARTLLVECTFVFVVALVSRLIALEQAGMFDEYYHVLAAKQWLTDGSFGSPTEGFYDRAAAFTLLVMLSIKAFGLSLVSARIPALLAGALWPVAIYLGVRRIEGGRVAAVLAGVLTILDPTLLGLSQVARFYTLHGLLFWVGVFSLYSATDRGSSRRRRFFAAGLAVAAFAGALHLQVVTVIGFGAVVAGLLLADLPWMVGRLRARRRDVVTWVVLGIVGLAAVVAVFLMRSTLAAWWERFGWAPPWLAEQGRSVRYYHWWLQSGYPLFWLLLPLAGATAIVRRPRLAVLCLAALAVVFITSSLAASQLPRYFAYALPFLFILWGLALAELLPSGLRASREMARRTLGSGRWGYAVAAVVILFAAVNTPFWIRTARALHPVHPTAPYETTDWNRYRAGLEAELDERTVVVTTAGPPVLYHLHRLDYEVGTNFLPGGRSGSEFGVDSRLGRPVLTTPASLSLVVSCEPEGLLIVPEGHWRRSWGVSNELADWIEENLERTEVAAGPDLITYGWRGAVDAGTCSRPVGR